MELRYVNDELKEVRFENRTEVTAARRYLRNWATVMRQTLPSTYLEPSVLTDGTPEQRAARLEFSATNAVATALHEQTRTSLRLRGDVAVLHRALVDEMPSNTTSVKIPATMTSPTTIEMSELDFKVHALTTPAFTLVGTVVRKPG